MTDYLGRVLERILPGLDQLSFNAPSLYEKIGNLFMDNFDQYNLRHLILEKTFAPDKRISYFLRSLWDYPRLVSIKFVRNIINVEVLKQLSRILEGDSEHPRNGDIKPLRELVFENCNIMDMRETLVADILGKVPTLEVLDINTNDLCDSACKAIY